MFVLLLAPMYSASHVLVATDIIRRENHDIVVETKYKMPPYVDYQVSTQPAKAASDCTLC